MASKFVGAPVRNFVFAELLRKGAGRPEIKRGIVIVNDADFNSAYTNAWKYRYNTPKGFSILAPGFSTWGDLGTLGNVGWQERETGIPILPSSRDFAVKCMLEELHCQ
ncbi:hypothetical protein QA601_02490 [Chitinispirillales bacterium ANBcel5]|uniref:hypothetical protein n=1 Tax=Cellulosispirillum alkaliphilum TaxID=3039283 RepID=UPI002A55807A|nr:hypothetical protein [Chitinispirillales bacterium ANBcel5]